MKNVEPSTFNSCKRFFEILIEDVENLFNNNFGEKSEYPTGKAAFAAFKPKLDKFSKDFKQCASGLTGSSSIDIYNRTINYSVSTWIEDHIDWLVRVNEEIDEEVIEKAANGEKVAKRRSY